MSEAGDNPLDSDLNVGPDCRMRAMAQRSELPRDHDVGSFQEGAPAARSAAPRNAAVFLTAQPDQAAAIFTEPPVETDAWWLSRAQAATFARRRIPLSDEHVRALRARGDAPGRIVIEFNGASFGDAALAANEGRYELDLGDALAQEMAEVLDEDDGLAVELITGPGPSTLAIHPFVIDAR